MLKKMLLVAALFGGMLSSALGVESQAAEVAWANRSVPDVFILTLDGKLTRYEPCAPQIPEYDPWTGPGLNTGASWFGLDFSRNDKLAEQMKMLYGKTVRVTGRLEKRHLGGLIPHTIDVLVVTDMQPVPADGGSVIKTVQVEMKGQFLFRADHLDILKPDSRLIVNDKTYVINWGGNNDLWHSAVALDGHGAIVIGTLSGDTITATAIKPDLDYVHRTIKVEVRGRLVKNRPMRCLMTEFSVIAGGESFGVEFADKGLRDLAVRLSREDVVLRGTLDEKDSRGEVITVTELTAADGTIPQKVNVTVEGKLHYVIKSYHTGEILFTCEKLPEVLCRCWSITYGVTIDGHLYQLDVTGEASLREKAEKLVGHAVVAEGTLKKDVINAPALKSL